MGLPRRLALLTAVMAVLLVLLATEVSLSLSQRSRLDDFRTESIALADTWAKFVAHLAPTGDLESLRQALVGWPAQQIARTQAAVFVRQGGGLVRVATSAQSEVMVAAPEDSAALATGVPSVWHIDSPHPGWQVSMPLGGARPYGVLRVSVSTRRLQEWARSERLRAYVFALLSALLVASGVAFLTGRWVGRPLARLGRVMAQAHGGVESAPAAKETGAEEFRLLARRYNELRDALAVRQRESDARAALLALEERARGFDRLALMEETAAEFAHEIGTPLNTVRGHLQLLRDDVRGVAGAPVQDRIHLLIGQVDRVAAIVRTQLAGRRWPTPAPSPTDLYAVAHRMLDFLEPSLARAGVRATLLPLRRPGTVLARCDPALVEQILLNLLKNAIEALAPGDAITIRVGTTDGTPFIEVADSGPGLADEARQHLFEPFSTTKGGGGTGLGLAVSRRLARASGGDLMHLPTERGTTWRLTLPFSRPDD